MHLLQNLNAQCRNFALLPKIAHLLRNLGVFFCDIKVMGEHPIFRRVHHAKTKHFFDAAQ